MLSTTVGSRRFRLAKTPLAPRCVPRDVAGSRLVIEELLAGPTGETAISTRPPGSA